MERYNPPYEISNKMLDYVANIMEKIAKIDNYTNLNRMPVLRKNNRINSIHSSLAIEANSLTVTQVKDVINGKVVMGPNKEIQEVKNAYNAYEKISETNPYDINDLKKIHGIMTFLTVEESGEFRKGNEGVFDGDRCIFMAPKPELVPSLMEQLFTYINEAKEEVHPLILAAVFHYEFLFIHPFADGNGRMARLWQNILLSKWKEVFEYIPLETMIKKYQNEYYTVINNCNKNGNSNEFIEFMLKMIDEVLTELLDTIDKEMFYTNIYINKLLEVMDYKIPMSSNEIMDKLGVKSKETLRANYIDPALENGLIKMTLPDKPTSKNQMYYKI